MADTTDNALLTAFIWFSKSALAERLLLISLETALLTRSTATLTTDTALLTVLIADCAAALTALSALILL